MTEFTVGELVQKKKGEAKPGKIVSIVLSMGRKKDRVSVLTKDGELYETAAHNLMYVDGKRKA